MVLGYLLAGFLVGPHSPGPSFVGNSEVMGFLGELGIVFLLFALGLEFNLSKLKKVGATAIITGTIQIGIMIWLGYILGRSFGWGPLEAIFLGAVMSISSTVIVVKVLAERGQQDKEWAQLALGILIIEDILAVLILTGLSSAAASGNFQPALLLGLGYKLAIFLGTAFLVGLMVAPRLVDFLAKLHIEEVVVIVSVGVGIGLALLAAQLGFSAGLGAFIAGALMAESPRVTKIEHKIAPIRDLFTAIFFVTVGALIDPASLLENWGLILAVTLAVVVGKIFALSLPLLLMGRTTGEALTVGVALAQIGEFSFIIAALGASLSVTPPALYPVAIAVCVITSFVTPYLMRGTDGLTRGLHRLAPSGVRAYASGYRAWLQRVSETDRAAPEWRAVRTGLITLSLAAAAIVGIVAAGVAINEHTKSFGAESEIAALGLAGIEYAIIVFAATPFMIVWYNGAKKVVHALARIAVPPRLRVAESTRTELLLRRTFGLLTALVTGAFILLVITPFVGVTYALVLVIAGVAVNTFLFGQSLSRYHREVQLTVDRIIASRGGEATPEAKAEALSLITDARAWGAQSREVAIPIVSGGAGRTLGDLRLRALTGASVIRVTRATGEQAPTTNPGADFRFLAGDRVLLLGENVALLRAEEILLGRELGVEGGATEVPIPPGSPFVGEALGALRLRERTGAQALVLRRGRDILAAEPTLTLQAGDLLAVAGTEDEVRRLRQLLELGVLEDAPPRTP